MCTDTLVLCTVLEAATDYFCIRTLRRTNHDHFKGFLVLSALKNDCYEEISVIIANKTPTPKPEDASWCVLPLALGLAPPQTRQYCVEKFSTVEKVNWVQGTTLCWVICYGYWDVVRLLLEEGIGAERAFGDAVMRQFFFAVYGTNFGYSTPIQRACRMGVEPLVLLLLDMGARFDDSGTGKHGSALHLAAIGGHESIARILIERGIDIHRTTGGWSQTTPLHDAVIGGSIGLVKHLLDLGVAIDKKSSYKTTALAYAASQGRAEIAMLLIERGADIEAQGEPADGPVLHSAAEGGSMIIVRALAERGANLQVKDQNRRTALHKAAYYGHSDVVEFLVDNGLDVNAKANESSSGGYGVTPLHHAATSGDDKTVQVLINRGADREARNEKGWTPLHAAICRRRAAVVSLLIKHKVDVEAKDQAGNTSLDLAYKEKDENVIQLLLEGGANPGTRDGVVS